MINPLRSSYQQNSFKEIFSVIVACYQPMVCVELGVLDGYSTIAIASVLKHLSKYCGISRSIFNAYDLFEDYPFTNARMKDTEENIRDAGVAEYVTLHKMDAFKVPELYQDNSVDLLHVDLSNTGEILRTILNQWTSKITPGGIIMFEGGTPARDRIEWMIKYKKEPIAWELHRNETIRNHYHRPVVVSAFPSMTILEKK